MPTETSFVAMGKHEMRFLWDGWGWKWNWTTLMFSFFSNADYLYLIRRDVVTFGYLLVKFFHVRKLWNDTSWTAMSLLAVKNQLRFWYRRIGVMSRRRTRSVTSRMFLFAFRVFRLIFRLPAFKHDRPRRISIRCISNKKGEQYFTVFRKHKLKPFSGEQSNHGKQTTPIRKWLPRSGWPLLIRDARD